MVHIIENLTKLQSLIYLIKIVKQKFSVILI